MKIAIIGEGNVGSALQRGLQKNGNQVETTGNDPDRVREITGRAEVIFLAVPFSALDDVASVLRGETDSKVVVDVTNVLTPQYELALGFTTSGTEELQKKLSSAKVVKAFNTVFAGRMDTGQVKGQQLTVLVASDHEEAKKTVMDLARSIGFDAVDAGPLKNARMLEPLGYLNIQLAYSLGLGVEIGFKLVR